MKKGVPLEQYASRVSYMLVFALFAFSAWRHESILIACTLPVFLIGCFRLRTYRSELKWWIILTFHVLFTAWMGFELLGPEITPEGIVLPKLFWAVLFGFGTVQVLLLVSGRIRRVWEFCNENDVALALDDREER